MITAAEFLEQWNRSNESPQYVRYPQALMASCGVSAGDRLFLAEAGLPSIANQLHFFFEGGELLPPPADGHGRVLQGAPSGLGMIGSTAEDWPICLDPARPGQILCLRLDSDLLPQLVNSSFRQLAACLIAYRNTVDSAIAHGDSRGNEDAWRNRDYPPELDAQMQAEMQAIDPAAFSPDGYWPWHFTTSLAPSNNRFDPSGDRAMKIYGHERVFERDAEQISETPLNLREATIVATPGQIRNLAQFLLEAADEMDRFGPKFDHEHFCDFCKRRGIDFASGSADLIVISKDSAARIAASG